MCGSQKNVSFMKTKKLKLIELNTKRMKEKLVIRRQLTLPCLRW